MSSLSAALDGALSRVALPPAEGPGSVRIRFDRNELAGAFGDLGTDLPLLVGMMAAAHLDVASVLVMFGLMQILTGLRYRMPMPVQPLKAMAALVIAHRASGEMLVAGGVAIGVLMLLLTVTGLIDWLAAAVPKPVVRGIQAGLGTQLVLLAVGKFMAGDGARGFVLAATGLLLVLGLGRSRRYPAALAVVALGIVYAAVTTLDGGAVVHGVGLRLPLLRLPASWSDLSSGLVLLTLPQLPLSLGNSVLATRQLAGDLFPGRAPSLRTIGVTYGLMNVVGPLFGGVPTCHGSGGMAGHYAFGGRTGGSVILYGSLFLAAGLWCSGGFEELIKAFPLPLLGVLLLVEGSALVGLARDQATDPYGFAITALVALTSITLPYGYAVALVLGTAVAWLPRLAPQSP